MIVYPNAKINIGLNITKKREDGFHNIESIFYPIGIKDILEIIPNKGFGSVKVTSSGIPIPGKSNHNLCVNAYHLLKDDFDMPSIQLHLHKQIPIGAGLGGGSSDAAFTLIALNTLFNLGLTKTKLKKFAAKLGSDCAFFIENKPTYNFNKGDEFTLFNIDLSSYYLVLSSPNIHVSTADAYAGVSPSLPSENIRDLISRPIETWKNTVVNDFEYSVFGKYPEIETIKNKLYQAGAIYASMSGSGSSVFGIFEKEVNTEHMDFPIMWSGKMGVTF